MKALPAILVAAVAAALAAPAGASAASGAVEVYKTRTCACCVAWTDRLKEAGFAVEVQDLPMADLVVMKLDLGIPPDLVGCHTALVEGYVVEGHVPPDDIERLLESRPDAVGLAVPGMPTGSPGMEYGTRREAFDVTLVGRDGQTSVFESYDARE